MDLKAQMKEQTMAQMSSGIESDNFWVNMSTYLFAGAAFIIFMIGMLFAAKFLKGAVQGYIKKRYKAIMAKFFFNG
jgi:membrane-bound acyltransferase YfiQ involved in biofilm formation